MTKVGTSCALPASGFTFCSFRGSEVPSGTEIFDNEGFLLGVTSEMPGTGGGFTMIAFNAEYVPVGISLFIA